LLTLLGRLLDGRRSGTAHHEEHRQQQSTHPLAEGQRHVIYHAAIPQCVRSDGLFENLEISKFWMFLLEGAIALAILIFIVWWTLPKKKK